MNVETTNVTAMEARGMLSAGSRCGSPGRRGAKRHLGGWQRWAWCGVWAGLISSPLVPALGQETPQPPAATSPAATSPAVGSAAAPGAASPAEAAVAEAAVGEAAVGEAAAVVAVATASSAGVEAGAEGSLGSEPSSARKPPAGRLPRYFASLVDSRQRAAIYQIQATMAARIADLEKQLLDLRQQEQREVEGVLTDEQRQQLQVLRSSRSMSVSSR